MKSTALINSLLEDLIEKSYNGNYMDILKAIDFTAKDWRKVDAEARKGWLANGKKGLLSNFVLDVLQREYPDEQMENLIWPNDKKLTIEERIAESNSEERDLSPEEMQRERLRQHMDSSKPDSMSGPKDTPDGEEHASTRPFNMANDDKFSGTADAQRMEQFIAFGDKLLADKNKRESSKNLKERTQIREEGVARATKDKKKSDKERKLRQQLIGNREESEGVKLWEELLQSIDMGVVNELIKLLGTPTNDKELFAKRLRRFIAERLPPQHNDIKPKLEKVAEALEEEHAKGAEDRLIDTTGKTSTALLAKSNGNQMGKRSKMGKTNRLTIKWGVMASEKLKALTAKQSLQLINPKFVKFTLTDDRWLTNDNLKPITETWLSQINLTLIKYTALSEPDKLKAQTKINRLKGPTYLEPNNLLAILYGTVWEKVKDDTSYEIPNLDFGYWLEGFTQGVQGIKPNYGVDELSQIIRISKSILPALIKAIDEGIVLDPDSGKVSVVGIQRRYHIAINKIPESLRNKSILTMFKIMNGEPFSNKLKGKNKSTIKDAEQSIQNQVAETRHGKSLFSLLLKAHLAYTKNIPGKNILLELLKDEEDNQEGEIKVDFATPDAKITRDEEGNIVQPKKKQGKVKSRKGEKLRVNLGTITYTDENDIKRKLTSIEEPEKSSNGKYIRLKTPEGDNTLYPIDTKWVNTGKGEPNPSTTMRKPQAGKKFVEANLERRESLEEQVNADGKKKYTDREIDEMVGSRPTREVERISTDFSGNRTTKKVNVTDQVTKLPVYGKDHDKAGQNKYANINDWRAALRNKKDKDGKKYTKTMADKIIGYTEAGKRVKKSLDALLEELGESDDIIFKEDTGLILSSLNKTQKKKLKTILNVADPTEYFGHDFLKLQEVIKVLKTLGVVKGDKKLGKKVIKLEDKNLKVVKLATRLRKDYENLYRDIRELIYPKTGEDEK